MSSSRSGSASGRRRRSAAERAANYVHIKTVGKGSYGTVDLVKRKDNHKLYVMKRVKYAADEKEHKGALQEVKFLRMLKHPNVVDFGEAFVTPDRSFLCIVMGYCEGGDLIHKIREFRKADRYIPEDTVMEWFVQMAMALAYLHDQRILHRDIKPHNVFLTNHGRVVKVGDFGVTRILDHTHSMAKTTIGTPYYVSPEICCNKPYNAKSDVWALGVVLYELCQLRVPFDAANFPQLRVKIVHNKPAPLTGPYSPELQQLVSDMLIKDQRKRPDVRTLLKRRLCQHHLRLLMQRHSKKPAPSKSSVPQAGSATSKSASFMNAQRKQSKLEAKLEAKQRALERAQGEDDKTPRRVDVGGAQLSHHQREDFIGSDAKRPEEAEQLAKEVEEVKADLVKTAVQVHALVTEDERGSEENDMMNNAKTIVADALRDPAPEGKDDSSDEEKNNSTLGSVGHELVHQMSLGRVKVNPAHIQDGAALRDRDSPVVQKERAAAGAGGGIRQSGHGRSGSITVRSLEDDDDRGAKYSEDEPAVASHAQPTRRPRRGHGSPRKALPGHGAPVSVPRLDLERGGLTPAAVQREPTPRTTRSAGGGSARIDPYGRSGRTNSRGSSRGMRPASKGRSRRGSEGLSSGGFADDRRSSRTRRSSARSGYAQDSERSHGSAYGESRASRMSRPDSRSLLAKPMGVDAQAVMHDPDSIVERLPDVRPESRGRPLTAGSDFSEGLDQNILASVRSVDQRLSARRSSNPALPTMGHSQSHYALRRRVEASVLLQPLGAGESAPRRTSRSRGGSRRL